MCDNSFVTRIGIVYSGVVQGVGFRVTAKRIADDLGVTGWVRNNHDGTVTLAAQGTQDQIHDFRERLRAEIHGRIDREDETADPGPIYGTSFEIAR